MSVSCQRIKHLRYLIFNYTKATFGFIPRNMYILYKITYFPSHLCDNHLNVPSVISLRLQISPTGKKIQSAKCTANIDNMRLKYFWGTAGSADGSRIFYFDLSSLSMLEELKRAEIHLYRKRMRTRRRRRALRLTLSELKGHTSSGKLRRIKRLLLSR